MKEGPKVYSWGDFVAFVNRNSNHDPALGSHPVVDAIAGDLLEQRLIRRDASARPVGPWKLPSELSKSYLLPAEVNARPAMKNWLLEWDPVHQLTPAEELAAYGWKGALQLEEKRIRASFKAKGLRLPNTTLAATLWHYAKTNGIQIDRGRTPSANYIRNWIISKSKGKNPGT
jgi:hypothetical protein